MSERLAGVEIGLYINIGTPESPEYEMVGGQTDATLTIEPDDIDVSSKDGGGWKNNRNGLIGWSIDAPGTFITDKDSLAKVEDCILDESDVLVKIELPSGEKRQGNVKIKSFVLQAPVAGGFTYSIKMLGNGALTSITNTVTAPSVTVPLDDAADIALEETLKTSAFAVSGGEDTHVATQWQITTADDDDFETPVFDVTSTTAKLAFTLGGDELEVDTDYLIRARHKGLVYGWSAWSDVNAFDTVDA